MFTPSRPTAPAPVRIATTAGIGAAANNIGIQRQFQRVEYTLARSLQTGNVRNLDRTNEYIVPIVRAPHSSLSTDAQRTELVERHARTRAAQCPPLHLGIVDRVPLALEPHVRGDLRSEVLLSVFSQGWWCEGAPG